MARQKGATNEQAEAIRDPERGPFTAREKLGFRAAERLHRSPYELDDEFYALLKRGFSHPEIIELVATASAWEFFTRFVDALRIPTTPLTGAHQTASSTRPTERVEKNQRAKRKG